MNRNRLVFKNTMEANKPFFFIYKKAINLYTDQEEPEIKKQIKLDENPKTGLERQKEEVQQVLESVGNTYKTPTQLEFDLVKRKRELDRIQNV